MAESDTGTENSEISASNSSSKTSYASSTSSSESEVDISLSEIISPDLDQTVNWSTAMELERFALLESLAEEFKASVKLAVVFGIKGKTGLLVTKNDDVFGIGSNEDGCLGMPVDAGVVHYAEPTRIDSLSQKGLVGLSYGEVHVAGWNSQGQVIVWGYNYAGQGGNGTVGDEIIEPTNVGGLLEGKNVIKVACGYDHIMAITDDGELFSWGGNFNGQIGCGTNENVLEPLQITFDEPKKIIDICCNSYTSFAIADDGSVFAWGNNEYGQIGDGTVVSKNKPELIINYRGMKKLACGYNHTLALAEDGTLLAWGQNNVGQVGNGTQLDVKGVINLGEISGFGKNVTDIAAAVYMDLSACVVLHEATGKERVYAWGNFHAVPLIRPILTGVPNVESLFAVVTPSITPGTIAISGRKEPKGSLLKDIKDAFDNPYKTDVTFVIDGKKLHAMQTLLLIRSTVMEEHFNGPWKDATLNGEEIQIDMAGYDVFRALLYYLHTDELKIAAKDLLDFMKLAEYFKIGTLRKEVEELLVRSITVENAAKLFGEAKRYDSEALKEAALKFVAAHWTSVMTSHAFMDLEAENAKALALETAMAVSQLKIIG